MSALAEALLRELDDDALDALADRLAPRLAARQLSADDGWLRGADAIADHLACPVSRVYALSSAGRLPVERDGRNLVALRSTLDRWLREGGGRRP